MMCEAVHYHALTHTRTEQTTMHVSSDFQVDHNMLGSPGHVMLQDLTFTHLKEWVAIFWPMELCKTSLVSGRKYVTTPCWFDLSPAGSNISKICHRRPSSSSKCHKRVSPIFSWYSFRSVVSCFDTHLAETFVVLKLFMNDVMQHISIFSSQSPHWLFPTSFPIFILLQY